MIYFISGHRNITKEDFEKYYIKKIDNIIAKDKDFSFVVGDYYGVDIMAQTYLVEAHLADRVTVYHMFDKPRNLAKGIARTVGGFKSDEERDSAMTNNSDFDILYIDHSPSGTEQNLLRRYYKNFKPKQC